MKFSTLAATALITPLALFAGSPVMSATYTAGGSATGSPNESRDTQGSVSGGAMGGGSGGIAIGFGTTFGATATGFNGGLASASSSEGIGDAVDYGAAGAPAFESSSLAAVDYTMEVVGPTTDALVPVHVTMVAHVDALSIPGPVGGEFYFPIDAGAAAQVSLDYVNNGPSLPFVAAGNGYDYQYYAVYNPEGRGPAPVVESQTDSFDGVVMIRANEPIDVLIAANAAASFNVGVPLGSVVERGETESATGGAFADPTFTIDDPAYADYTIEGVPEGPAAVATPEPATWAMMLIGFAGLGYARYRRKLCATSRAVERLRA